MISVLAVLEVQADSHVQESRMNMLPHCSCAISATRFIPGTLGRTAPGPLCVSCMHKTLTHITINAGSSESPSF